MHTHTHKPTHTHTHTHMLIMQCAMVVAKQIADGTIKIPKRGKFTGSMFCLLSTLSPRTSLYLLLDLLSRNMFVEQCLCPTICLSINMLV